MSKGRNVTLIRGNGFPLKRSPKINPNDPCPCGSGKSMKIVYICHPIASDVKGNIKKIIKIIRDINLTNIDVVPFAPYLGDVLALNDNNPHERERGMKNCTAVLDSGMVAELWVYGPTISSGMETEIKIAIENEIPVRLMDPGTCVPFHMKELIKYFILQK